MQGKSEIKDKTSGNINILIVEDQKIVRQMMETAISKNKNYKIAYSIENAALADMYCAKTDIDLIIMDVFTYDRENGLEAARKIKKDYPNIKIIIVTSMPEHSFIQKAKDYKCDSFWYKDADIEDFLNVIEKTLNGEKVYPNDTPILQIGLAKSTEFTQRELEVLREMINGYSQKEICEHLNIAKTTLNYHTTNLLIKSGYDNKLKLIIDVTDKKLIIPGF